MALEIKSLAPLLTVYDMPRAVNFYTKLLGFELTETSEEGDDYEWARLTYNQAELMLFAAYDSFDRPSNPDPDRTAYHMDTAIWLACDDVDGVYDQLIAKGINARPPKIVYYGRKQVFCYDPDGFQICFYCLHAVERVF